MTTKNRTDARSVTECPLCETEAPHRVFITAPPGWGSIMPCSDNSRRNGIVVRNDAEIEDLRAERIGQNVSPGPGRTEYAVSAPSGELKVYATREWAEKAADGAGERILARTVSDGHYGPWKPHRRPEAVHEDVITIPRPHVPHGPQGIPEDQADADYLREAAQKLDTHYKPFGSNLRATIVQLLHNAADAVAGERGQGT